MDADSFMHRFDKRIRSKSTALIIPLLAVLSLTAAACGSQTASTNTDTGAYPTGSSVNASSVTQETSMSSSTMTEMSSAMESSAAANAKTPLVTVSDQAVKDDRVTIEKVVSQGPGWIVIHADKNGTPGPVLGYAAVKDGENTNVMVKLAASGRTAKLYAMLHQDAGQVGVYEFPGADTPVKGNQAEVNPSFNVTGGAASQGEMSSPKAAVQAINGDFDPKELTVKVGTTVVWTNADPMAHTVTADDNSFDSGRMGKGDTFSYTFAKAGEYSYYCTYHGSPGGSGMSGKIIVTN